MLQIPSTIVKSNHCHRKKDTFIHQVIKDDILYGRSDIVVNLRVRELPFNLYEYAS